ncbi:ATP-grasp domain-containing protein [Microbacterium aoyamense]|uniref:ATP-grasp domain-containing protein n=1 Tax=Microbacterium aoyamense TaxID=344166 RepID=UPI002003DBCD|nr:ATP-grasp domain-containing protein [Microbacterium aoyamense]
MSADGVDESLPVFAIVYHSVEDDPPLHSIAAAAKGVCRLLWVLPIDRRDSRSALRLLRAAGDITGEILDVSGLSALDAADVLRGYAPRAITCLADTTIVWTAQIAELLGLKFHSIDVAERLTDKLKQRMALSASDLRTPPFWDADDLANADAISAVARSTTYPLVIKPRSGSSSKDTEPIGSEEQLRAAISNREPGRMLVEGYIPDPTRPCLGAMSAPYVSVELLASAGTISVLEVTGKPPLAPPFRETGNFVPADITEEQRAEFVDVAIKATRAIGVTDGVLHVEIKCTDDGPVVIEINGRPGGGRIRDFIQRAHGIDTIALMMRVALGEHIAYTDLPLPSDVLLFLVVPPDISLTHVSAVDGLEEVRQIIGVEHVEPGPIGAGDEFSWRDGTMSHVAQITAVTSDHAEMWRLREEVLNTIRIEGTRT